VKHWIKTTPFSSIVSLQIHPRVSRCTSNARLLQADMRAKLEAQIAAAWELLLNLESERKMFCSPFSLHSLFLSTVEPMHVEDFFPLLITVVYFGFVCLVFPESHKQAAV
jgi:hypothetical protein